jgi:hypothetical protein
MLTPERGSHRLVPMKKQMRWTVILFANTVLVLALSLPFTAAGQTATAVPNTKIPRRTAEGKPDFNGMWQNPRAKGKGENTNFDRTLMAPLKPGGEMFLEPRTGDARHDDPRAFCFPSGFPSNMLAAYPIQIVQSKDTMVIVHEFMRMTRIIPLDGRPHRDDIEPTYFGDSVGRWEGDGLVIDSTHFKRWSLDDSHYANPNQYRMHSDALHTIERIHFVDDKTISYNLTIDDPKIFTAPWSEEFFMTYKPEWDKAGLYEFVCEENNRCPGGQCEVNK